ncbi:thermonuclease family protein [Sphingomonas glacialis]|uniref:thermonuclease family protein n=1 Tax=Sphingomonas glacialis TaxID=658225 RepID=UPI001F4F1F01|nr:thermonuclease family protein [Sphingomonas glacialis]
MLGIDAPALASHCQQRRRCAPGDPHASTSALRAALTMESIRFQQFGTDHCGRTLALFSADRGDLSCWQLRNGQDTYKPWWDNGGQLARIYPAAPKSGTASAPWPIA